MPLVIWLGAVFVAFVVLSIIFFLADWINQKIMIFRKQSDIDNISVQIMTQAIKSDMDLGEPPRFRNPEFRLISKIISRFHLSPKIPSDDVGIPRIDGIFEVMKQINLGYEQNIKKYRFSTQNEFFIKNLINAIKRDYKSGFNIINDAKYSESVRKEAFLLMCEKAVSKDLYKMIETSLFLDKEMFMKATGAIMSEYNKTHYKIDDGAIFKAAKRSKMQPLDYVALSKLFKAQLDPDDWLKIFENLAIMNERAELAFLYVLCDLEMIDLAQKRLSTLPKTEYLKIRAYVDLRKNGASYPLELFF